MPRVLDITTGESEPELVAIDGVEYAIRHADTLGLAQSLQVQAMRTTWQRILEQIEADGMADDALLARVEVLSTRLFEAVLPTLPAEVRARLSGRQQAELLLRALAPREVPDPLASSGISSPASPGSTEESRPAGSAVLIGL
jgi:hypothetical protein